MNISQAGIDLIKQFEGCKLQSYQDQGGVWTCGYGSTGSDIGAGLVWNILQAEARLISDIHKFETGVTNLLKVPAPQNCFDALVSFSYNLGLGALGSSSLLHCINNGQFAAAAAEFPKWDHCCGQVVQGLLNRRLAEQKLFMGGDSA